MKKIVHYINCPQSRLIVGKDISVDEILEADFIIWDYNGREILIDKNELANAKAIIKQWYPVNQFRIRPPLTYFCLKAKTSDYVVVLGKEVIGGFIESPAP